MLHLLRPCSTCWLVYGPAWIWNARGHHHSPLSEYWTSSLKQRLTPILDSSLSHTRQANQSSKINGFECETPFPAFSLYGKASSFSRNHIDPDGLNSGITI